mgnify:CR=1
MKIEFYIYAIRDGIGNEWGIVAEEPATTVQVNGLLDAKGELAWFEAEAYHLKSYAKDHGFTYAEEIRNLEINL